MLWQGACKEPILFFVSFKRFAVYSQCGEAIIIIFLHRQLRAAIKGKFRKSLKYRQCVHFVDAFFFSVVGI